MRRIATILLLIVLESGCSRTKAVGDAPRGVSSEMVTTASAPAPRATVQWVERGTIGPTEALTTTVVWTPSFDRARRVGRLLPSNDIVVETSSGAVRRLTEDGDYDVPIASRDGARIAFAKPIRNLQNPCGITAPNACAEIWEVEAGRPAVRVLRPDDPSEPFGIPGLSPAKYSADGKRLFVYSRGGFIGNACLLSLTLAEKKIAWISCGGAVLEREVTLGPHASSVVVFRRPLMPGGGRSEGVALFTADGKWLRELPDDPNKWP